MLFQLHVSVSVLATPLISGRRPSARRERGRKILIPKLRLRRVLESGVVSRRRLRLAELEVRAVPLVVGVMGMVWGFERKTNHVAPTRATTGSLRRHPLRPRTHDERSPVVNNFIRRERRLLNAFGRCSITFSSTPSASSCRMFLLVSFSAMLNCP